MNFDYYKRGNIAINSVILGDKTKWKHSFIGIDGCPCIDIDKKIIYVPPFGTLSESETNFVYAASIHENSHALLTPRGPNPKSPRLQNEIVNCLEDLRIERAISRKLPFTAHVLNESVSVLHGMFTETLKNPPVDKDGNVGKINPIKCALHTIMYEENGFPVNCDEDSRAYVDLMKPLFSTWKDLPDSENPNGFKHIEELAEKIYNLIKGDDESEDGENQDDKSENGESSENDESSENGESENDENQDGESSDGKSESGESENSESSDGESENDENQDGKSSDGKPESGENQDGKSSDGKPESGENQDGKSSDGKPEKDANSQVKKKSQAGRQKDIDDYEKSGESVEDDKNKALMNISKDSIERTDYVADTSNDVINIAKENSERYNYYYEKVSSKISSLYRYLEQAVLTRSKAKRYNNVSRGKLNMRDLPNISKSLNPNIFYKTVDGTKLDTCITICIDQSGSMRGSISDVVSLVIAFSHCLHRLGVPFQIIGGTTVGFGFGELEGKFNFDRYNPIEYNIYKTFDEQFGLVKNRLGSLSAKCNYVDGEMIQNVCSSMNNRREKRKIVLSFCDGIPQAGHSNDSLMGANLKHVVKTQRERGFNVYGFGIGTDEPAEYYGKDNFVYLKNIHEMDLQFFSTIKNIIGV